MLQHCQQDNNNDNKEILPVKRLSPVDQVFLWLEKRQQPMHVGGLQLFRFPDDAGDDYVARLADQLRAETVVTPPFNLKLTSKFGQPGWTEDKELDLEHHFRLKPCQPPVASASYCPWCPPSTAT